MVTKQAGSEYQPPSYLTAYLAISIFIFLAFFSYPIEDPVAPCRLRHTHRLPTSLGGKGGRQRRVSWVSPYISRHFAGRGRISNNSRPFVEALYSISALGIPIYLHLPYRVAA